MREIKFRAWHTNKPYGYLQMEYGIENASDIDSTKTVFPDFGCYLYSQREQACIVMEFTGLKDKQGRDIYEGDIFRAEGGEIGEVAYGTFASSHEAGWAKGHIHIGFYLMRDGDTVRNRVDEDVPWAGGEVIGNIYENPELLAKEKI